MSRIGNKPVALPSGVSLEVKGRTINVKGPKGQLSWDHPLPISVANNDGTVSVSRANDERKSRELHGLTRALIANMVKGVTDGYEIGLEIYGTGYGCNLKGKTFELNCGFMGRSVNKGPQFTIPVPDGIEIDVETPNARGDSDPAKFKVRGIDKALVGKFASEIRALRKPEPYKGKGIRYAGEHVRRKQGKALAGSGG